MSEPQLLICELTSRWAIAWRRTLGGDFPIGEVRSLLRVDDRLSARFPPLVAVDATGFLAGDLLPAIARWSQAGSPVIVLASPALAEMELVFREAGAVQVVLSPRELDLPARLVRRHLRQAPSKLPSDQSLEQSIRGRLPWARYARNGE